MLTIDEVRSSKHVGTRLGDCVRRNTDSARCYRCPMILALNMTLDEKRPSLPRLSSARMMFGEC